MSLTTVPASERRLEFLTIALEISRDLIAAGRPELATVLESAVERIGRFAGVELAYVHLLDDKHRFEQVIVWVAEGMPEQITPRPGQALADYCPTLADLMLAGIVVPIDEFDVETLAPQERLYVEQGGVRSMCFLPLMHEARCIGLAGVANIARARTWGRTDIVELETFAQLAVQAAVRIRLERKLQASENRAHLVAQHVADGLATIGADGRVTWASGGIERVTGWQPDDVLGKRWDEIVHPDDVGMAIDLATERRDSGAPALLRLRNPVEGWRWVEATFAFAPTGDRESETVVVLRDAHDRTLEAQRLASEAITDPLTGLLNRTGLSRNLDAHTGPLALAFVDLNDFKGVNDRYGHDAGDAVLTEVGRRLVAAVRTPDSVARLGGDEYVVMAPGVSDELTATLIAERLQAELAPPIRLGNDLVPVGASVGVAVGSGACEPRSLLAMADQAMYVAKRRGGGPIVACDL